MPNRYEGVCYKCGKTVASGAGVFEKTSRVQRKKWPELSRNVKWLTQHHECVRAYSADTHYVLNPKPPLYAVSPK